MKRCFKCGAEKPRSEFYRHPLMADGLLGKCKSCTKADVSAHRQRKIAEVRAYDRRRGARRTAEDTRRWRDENPEKHAAHRAVREAVRSGRLTPRPCERCGADEVHGHHDNYAKPLEVRWLCAAHHKERHRELEAQRTSEAA